MQSGNCPTMQIPGPTLIVTEGDKVTVTLTNKLPTAAGNTSILFPGFQVNDHRRGAGPADGRRRRPEARSPTPSGDIARNARVLQRNTGRPAGRDGALRRGHRAAQITPRRSPLHAARCLGQLQRPGTSALQWRNRLSAWRRRPTTMHPPATTANICFSSRRSIRASTSRRKQPSRTANARPRPARLWPCQTEPYHPTYFMVNGRSMPDDMDPNYALGVPASAL